MAVRIEKELENELSILVKELNKTKSDFVKESIKTYLEKLKEEKIKQQKKAIEFLLNHPIDTGIKSLKAIQKIKSEKDIL